MPVCGANRLAGCSTPRAPVGIVGPEVVCLWLACEGGRSINGGAAARMLIRQRLCCVFVNGFLFRALASAVMPGDDLLFQRLSVSTIGAVRFHGRVRDGIGWVTDAMVTKQ